MPTTAAVLYTLITVTNGGNVGHSGGYESLHMCEEAKSIAVSGRTIEENKERQARMAAAEKEQERQWRVEQGKNGVTTVLGTPSTGTFSSWPPPAGDIKYAECAIEPDVAKP